MSRTVVDAGEIEVRGQTGICPPGTYVKETGRKQVSK